MKNLISIFEVAELWWTDFQTIRDWYEFGSFPPPKIIDGKARWSAGNLDIWEELGYPRLARLSESRCKEFETALLLELRERRCRDIARRRAELKKLSEGT